MSDFKKLEVWQKAHALSLCVHRVTARIRGSQYASLRSQLFKSSMSIAANIVEGRSHKSEREFARFLGYALHSSAELEHHLIVGRDIEVIVENDFLSLISQTITVRKMLYGLIESLSESKPDNPPDVDNPTSS